MKGPLRVLVVLFLALPPLASAADPDAVPSFPSAPPSRERVWAVDIHSAWTLRSGEAAVPLSVVSTPGRAVVALTGGWIVLGPDLEVLPSSFHFLASNQPGGSPWAQAAGDAVISVTGSPGDLVALFPETAVTIRRTAEVEELSHFAITEQGFLFVQGRRSSGASQWAASIRELQPLPFFPAEVASAADGTAWAADSLQARPWRQENGFWKPLDVPQAPGRLATLAPFPDSTGYFAGGPGWVGSFSSDGKSFWIRDKDLSGQPLPRDLKIRTGIGRLYLWSAQARRVWCWNWNAEGPAGLVGAPNFDRLPDMVTGEIDRLEALGSVPEAQSLAQYGLELAQAMLLRQPFSPLWSHAADSFATRRQTLKERVIGAGVFVIRWSQPEGHPVAEWTWEPDAAWGDVATWQVSMRPYWEGRAYEPYEFALKPSPEPGVWPGAEVCRQGPLRLPSWMSLEFRPDGTDAPVHWTRVPLPAPPIPYEFPVE